MTPRIASAEARADHTIRIEWRDGSIDVVDFAPVVARGGVMTALADRAFFVDKLVVDADGYSVGWTTEPQAEDEVGGIDFSARSLWYRAHPDDLRRDHPAAAE